MTTFSSALRVTIPILRSLPILSFLSPADETQSWAKPVCDNPGSSVLNIQKNMFNMFTERAGIACLTEGIQNQHNKRLILSSFKTALGH